MEIEKANVIIEALKARNILGNGIYVPDTKNIEAVLNEPVDVWALKRVLKPLGIRFYFRLKATGPFTLVVF